MTTDEARKLKLNDRVMWDGFPGDQGTVTELNPHAFFVAWDNGMFGWIDFQDADKVEVAG